jgi:tetratricopeptide (TPR) repeat protein
VDRKKKDSDVSKCYNLSRGGGGFDISVVGESHYQENLRGLAGGVRKPDQYIRFDALLVPEPDNPYDPNAVAVVSEEYGTLGHLSREDALRYQGVFQALMRKSCLGETRASLIGGTRKKPSFGVVLDLLEPDQLLERVDEGGKAIVRARTGDLQGRHYTTFVEAVKALKRENKLQEAEELLLNLIEAVEEEAAKEKEWTLAPWYYEQLGVVYRKQKRYEDEVKILRRFLAHPGGKSQSVKSRLEKAQKLLDQQTAN